MLSSAALMPSKWLLGSLAWRQLSQKARAVPPPNFLPTEPGSGP